MSDLGSILGLAGVPLMEKEPAGWQPDEKQLAWLTKGGGKPNMQDPFIMRRMVNAVGGTPPPISYFQSDEDKEFARQVGFREGPAPVDDLNPPETATTAAAPKPAEPSKMTPLDKPAITRAATDNRSKGEMTPLDAEPTATDIDPDADGEDMNFNPDMSSIPAPKAEPGELKPADRVLDPEDEEELAAKYDSDIAAMQQAATPQASADAQRGATADKMRDTLNMLGGATQAQKDAMAANTWDPTKADGGQIDPDAPGEDMNTNPDMSTAQVTPPTKTTADGKRYSPPTQSVGDLDQTMADLQQAMDQDNGLDYDLDSINDPAELDYQYMGPDSVKNALNKALATEPKVDMDKPMPSNIRSGQDLYKALDGNLNWLDKNIK